MNIECYVTHYEGDAFAVPHLIRSLKNLEGNYVIRTNFVVNNSSEHYIHKLKEFLENHESNTRTFRVFKLKRYPQIRDVFEIVAVSLNRARNIYRLENNANFVYYLSTDTLPPKNALNVQFQYMTPEVGLVTGKINKKTMFFYDERSNTLTRLLNTLLCWYFQDSISTNEAVQKFERIHTVYKLNNIIGQDIRRGGQSGAIIRPEIFRNLEWGVIRNRDGEVEVGEDVKYIFDVRALGYKTKMAGTEFYKHIHKNVHLIVKTVENKVYNLAGKVNDTEHSFDEKFAINYDDIAKKVAIDLVKRYKSGEIKADICRQTESKI